MSAWYEPILERDLVPDALIRVAIRGLIQDRLREEESRDKAAFIEELKRSPLAIHTDAANEQHYEVPPEFFLLALGPHRKYSCCYWPDSVSTLEDAEHRSLEQVVERAGLDNGQRILELGCGWGSLSLFMAERFPRSQITAVSNSRPQREFIEAQARERGLTNLRVITANMVDFAPDGTFDRIVSVEMFEHMRNYRELFRRIRTWLNPGGALFVHIFSHHKFVYPFETRGAGDWMAEHFFTGGIMPSDDLFSRFSEDLQIAEHWTLDGTHYEKTARAWLENVDRNRDRVLEIFAKTYGSKDALRWLVRWRVFFMAVEELWATRNGQEWLVSHYLFRPV